MQHGSILPLWLLILCGIFALSTVFFACELGQRIIGVFKAIEFALEQSDWYLFPIETQRILSIITASAQEAVTLECFGSIACTRIVFKNVGTC